MPLASTIQEDNREEVVFNKYFGGKYKRNYISQDIQAWLAALLCCASYFEMLAHNHARWLETRQHVLDFREKNDMIIFVFLLRILTLFLSIKNYQASYQRCSNSGT